MGLVIARPVGLPPAIENALEDVIVPLQAYVNRELTTTWVSLARGAFWPRSASGTLVALNANMTIDTKSGFLKIAKQGSMVTVSFNLGITVTGTPTSIQFVLPFVVVGRSHNVAFDSGGTALSVTLGTPELILGLTTGYEGVSVLHFEKLSGAAFAASSYALLGQVQGEVVHSARS